MHGSLDWEFPPSSAAPFVRTSNPPCHSMPPKQMHVRHKNVNMLYSLDLVYIHILSCIVIPVSIYILWYYIHVYVYVWFAVGDSSWKRSPASIANLWGSWSRWTPWRRTWTWNSPLEKTRTCRWLEGRILDGNIWESSKVHWTSRLNVQDMICLHVPCLIHTV